MKDESEDNLTWWYFDCSHTVDKKLVIVVVKLFREI
jgi:hypothetical protein